MLESKRPTNWSGFTRAGLLPLLALSPFFLSLIANAVERDPAPSEQKRIRPALAFDQYLVNLREQLPSSMIVARFRFTNRSDRRVTIDKLVPSCGCMRPQILRGSKVLEPGESREFHLRIRTANETPGPHEYYCDVNYHDGQPQSTRVWFKVILPKKAVIVRPRALMIFQTNDKPVTRSIIVSNFTGRRIDLTDVTCSTSLVDVAIADAEIDSKNGERVLKVHLRVGALPAGRRHEVITIHTTDREFKELTVPLILEGVGSIGPLQ